MKDKEKIIDYSKSFIIVFLIISAVFLMFKAVIYEPNSTLANLIGSYGSSPDNKPSVSITNNTSVIEVEPVFMLVTAKDSSHFAVKYDSLTKDELFTQFSATLGEALGSSSEPKQVSTEQWQKALKDSGVYFDYLYPQPLSAIAGWLGMKITGSYASDIARRLYIGNKNGNIVLYYINEENGSIYSCDTESSFSSLSAKIVNYNMGSAKFAFEMGDAYKNLDPYFIFSSESTKLRSVSVTNPLQNNFPIENLLNIFGINSRSASKVPETDGSVVYVEGVKSLRIDASGKVLFSVTGKTGISVPYEGEEITVSEMITACSQIAGNSLGLISGDGKLGLTSIKNNYYPNFTTINYGYYVGGIPVTLPNDTFAASFQISGGTITRAELYFRQYTYSSESVFPLPEKQATAIVKSSGGEPILTYEDSGSGVTPGWIKSRF